MWWSTVRRGWGGVGWLLGVEMGDRVVAWQLPVCLTAAMCWAAPSACSG